jgi:protease I
VNYFSYQGATEMEIDLRGKRVAILVTDGFEQAELLEPRKALNHAGAATELRPPFGGQKR